MAAVHRMRRLTRAAEVQLPRCSEAAGINGGETRREIVQVTGSVEPKKVSLLLIFADIVRISFPRRPSGAPIETQDPTS